MVSSASIQLGGVTSAKLRHNVTEQYFLTSARSPNSPNGRPSHVQEVLMTNLERVMASLSRWPGQDDDRLSKSSGVKPRQQVNQICRSLEEVGRLTRRVGPEGKIINRLT